MRSRTTIPKKQSPVYGVATINGVAKVVIRAYGEKKVRPMTKVEKFNSLFKNN